VFFHGKYYVLILTEDEMGDIFLQTHLVTLPPTTESPTKASRPG
jgi:hypothetical protein